MLLCGCGEHTGTLAVAQAAPADPTPRPAGEADGTARFLAGLPVSPDNPYTALESRPAWKEHQRQLDVAWGKAEGELIKGLHQFQQQELNAPSILTRPVFYPFGGPDALVATAFFPNSPSYVFVGLEPPGTLPTREQIEKKDLPKYLGAIRETMSSELGRSFFITHQMDAQFRGQITDGLLLPIVQLLVRSNHTILSIRYVRVDEDGKVVERPANYQTTANFANKGVEIEFRTGSDPAVHKLSYFSANLDNQHLQDNKSFVTYLSHLT